MDISKAFDKLSHSSIVNSCVHFSLPSQLIRWISSYLSSRSQRVYLRGEVSLLVEVKSGVAQGSVLGPVLFCLVMNSLTNVCPNSIFIKYADDLTILHLLRDQEDDKLQDEIDNVLAWSNNNGLSLNFSKCFVMDVLTKKSLNPTSVKLHDDVFVQQSSSLLLLGCYLSLDMRWSIHVNYLIKKASRRLYLLIHLKRANCPANVIFTVYISFIRPILLYAFPAFCNIPMYLRRKLIRVERRALKIIGTYDKQCDLFDAGEKMCRKVFQKVLLQPQHPLRQFFDTRESFRTTRTNHYVIRRPKTATKRFLDSFIKFCPS